MIKLKLRAQSDAVVHIRRPYNNVTRCGMVFEQFVSEELMPDSTVVNCVMCAAYARDVDRHEQ